jgi:enoyl-CoA hydratase/carnithine racemase
MARSPYARPTETGPMATMLNLPTPKMIAEKRDGIGWMTFNQPEKRNAVSMAMWECVPIIMAEFERDPEIRVVVMKGAGGKAFVSGADISEFGEKRNDPANVEAYNQAVARSHEAMLHLTKPLIAMIEGFCIGGGMAVAINADLRIAADSSKYAVPAAKLGLGYVYDATKTLTDLVGPSFAKEIFFTARQFTAAEAWNMGLVNRVVPAGDLERVVTEEYAEVIAGNAPKTVRTAKATINETTKNPDKRDTAKLDRMVAECFASKDYVEGRTAFMEKRKPVFQDH